MKLVSHSNNLSLYFKSEKFRPSGRTDRFTLLCLRMAERNYLFLKRRNIDVHMYVQTHKSGVRVRQIKVSELVIFRFYPLLDLDGERLPGASK